MCFSTSTTQAETPRPYMARSEAATMAEKDTRRVASNQQGVYGNIFTSILGDAGYGQNAKKVELGGSATA